MYMRDELIDANNMADIEEELLLQANLIISSFSPKATTTSASKPKETSVLDVAELDLCLRRR